MKISFNSLLVSTTRILRHVPVVNIPVNLSILFAKHIVCSLAGEKKVASNRYLTYVKNCKSAKTILLIVPVFGSLVVVLINIAKSKKTPIEKEPTKESKPLKLEEQVVPPQVAVESEDDDREKYDPAAFKDVKPEKIPKAKNIPYHSCPIARAAEIEKHRFLAAEAEHIRLRKTGEYAQTKIQAEKVNGLSVSFCLSGFRLNAQGEIKVRDLPSNINQNTLKNLIESFEKLNNEKSKDLGYLNYIKDNFRVHLGNEYLLLCKLYNLNLKYSISLNP